LTVVGVAKLTYYLIELKEESTTFSTKVIKTLYFNELMVNLFLSNFQIDPNLEKNKSLVDKILNFGKIAA